MRITDADPPGTPPPNAGKGSRSLICPVCEKQSLARVDTEGFEIPAVRGAVVQVRTSRCTTPGCTTNVRFVLLSIGPVAKASTRAAASDRTGRASGRYVTVDDTDAPLIVVRLE